MSKTIYILTATVMVMALLVVNCGGGKDDVGKDTYKFAILPQYSDEILTEKFQSLAGYLSEETGKNIELVFAPDFETHAEWVKSGEVDFSYQNPVVYSGCMEDTQLLAMALKDPRKGSQRDKFRGIVFTRAEEGVPVVPLLENLPGHKVCVVSYISAGGYVSQMITLDERGIDTSTIEFYEAEGNEQENVLVEVSRGRADAGFVRATTWSMFKQADNCEACHTDIDLGEGSALDMVVHDKLVMIGETAWLPNWAFSAHSSVDEELASKVKEALFKLEPDSAELTAAKLTGFTEPDPEAYGKLKKYVE